MRRLIFIPLLAIFLLGQAGEDMGYPLPQGLKPLWLNRDAEINGVRIKADCYTTQKLPSQVLEEFSQVLTQGGWEFQTDFDTLGWELYRKDDIYLYVSPVGSSPASVYICKSSQPIIVCPPPDKKEYIISDMPGRDVKDIPRYPGTIRRLSVISDKDYLFTYETGDSVEKVARFYKQRLTLLGWKTILDFENPSQLFQKDKEVSSLKMHSFIFEKEEDSLNILIVRIKEREATIINITKNINTAISPF